uniref:Uncharacterized protein n=1 Tax=Glossina austeni TaxID=7395 RepID=A0A1A9VGV9_GLOAU
MAFLAHVASGIILLNSHNSTYGDNNSRRYNKLIKWSITNSNSNNCVSNGDLENTNSSSNASPTADHSPRNEKKSHSSSSNDRNGSSNDRNGSSNGRNNSNNSNNNNKSSKSVIIQEKLPYHFSHQYRNCRNGTHSNTNKNYSKRSGSNHFRMHYLFVYGKALQPRLNCSRDGDNNSCCDSKKNRNSNSKNNSNTNVIVSDINLRAYDKWKLKMIVTINKYIERYNGKVFDTNVLLFEYVY